MYINGVKCDACCKMHNMNILNHDLPKGWTVLVESGSDERMHFCSPKCLKDWAEKQTIAVVNVDILPNQLVFEKEVKVFRAEVIDNPSQKCGEFEVTQEDCEYWRDL